MHPNQGKLVPMKQGGELVDVRGRKEREETINNTAKLPMAAGKRGQLQNDILC